MYKLLTGGGAVALVVVVPLSIFLPIGISFENGPIENLQVVLLLGTVLYSFRLMLRSRDRSARSFHLFCVLMYVTLAMRELSWGRVFYPIDFDEDGPVFVDMADYVWRTEAYAFMVIVGLAMVVLLVRYVPVVRMMVYPLPVVALTVIAIGAALQYGGEHGWLIGKASGQVLEELSETIIYAMQPALCSYYARLLK